MSAAATAAGYLYASGRLRGRAQREQEEAQKDAQPEPQAKPPRQRTERPRVAPARHEVRVAALPPQDDDQPGREAKPRRTPTIQYRTRRWKPDAA
jgi:hypothetical protein